MARTRRWPLTLVMVALASTMAACQSTPGGPEGSARSTPTSRAARPTMTSDRMSHMATASTKSKPRTSSPSSMPKTSAPQIPLLSAAARAAGLVDIRTIVPDAIIDLRYATSSNFVHQRLYPIGARCLVHQSMAAGLAVAARQLRNDGLRIVFWDCYRPHPVQVHMFQIVPNPNWVARPGPYATSHESGRSVDVTVARAGPATSCPTAQQVQYHCLLDMGTGFDDFTPRAYAFATDGVSRQAQLNRQLLRKAMAAGGITVYEGEWWHFDGPGADVRRPLLNAPLG